MNACRSCGSALHHTFVDLGMSPIANNFLQPGQLNQMEPFYPLHVFVCDRCLLVQLPEVVSPKDLFSDYAYFSSYSETWLDHAKAYVSMAIDRFGLTERSQVIEIASNDGYLLQYFVAKGISALGIEPAANVADAAIRKGVPTTVGFFGEKLARNLTDRGTKADLLVGNNVLAHVPDLNEFVRAMKLLLHPHGTITLEFPHLMRLIEGNQFDTIYHEHFSYFSLHAVERVFADRGLIVFDVDELPTHGGSLRIYARHAGDDARPVHARVTELREREEAAGLTRLASYLSFGEKVKETKRRILSFLIAAKEDGKTIAGYGAPAKANTLLNYCGIRTDLIEYTVDRSPHKQGQFMPGTRIPIYGPERVEETRPDYLLILPWNLRDEVMRQMAHIRTWGGRFVIPIPNVEVV